MARGDPEQVSRLDRGSEGPLVDHQHRPSGTRRAFPARPSSSGAPRQRRRSSRGTVAGSRSRSRLRRQRLYRRRRGGDDRSCASRFFSASVRARSSIRGLAGSGISLHPDHPVLFEDRISLHRLFLAHGERSVVAGAAPTIQLAHDGALPRRRATSASARPFRVLVGHRLVGGERRRPLVEGRSVVQPSRPASNRASRLARSPRPVADPGAVHASAAASRSVCANTASRSERCASAQAMAASARDCGPRRMLEQVRLANCRPSLPASLPTVAIPARPRPGPAPLPSADKGLRVEARGRPPVSLPHLAQRLTLSTSRFVGARHERGALGKRAGSPPSSPGRARPSPPRSPRGGWRKASMTSRETPAISNRPSAWVFSMP